MLLTANRLSPRWFAIIFFLIVAVALLTSDKGQIAGDGIKRWEALDALVSDHKLTSDKYTIVQPLFAVPLYIAGQAYAAVMTTSVDLQNIHARNAVKRFNKVMAFCMALWMFYMLRNQAGWCCRPASIAIFFLLFGSILIPHAKDFYSECLWTLLCVVALTLLSHLRDRCLIDVSGRIACLFVSMLSLAVPLNPLLLIVFTLLLFLLALPRLISRDSGDNGSGMSGLFQADIVLLAISLPLGASLCLFENWLRRGNVLNFGYPGEGFSTPFLTGFTGQLISPTRGIVFYMPAFFCGFVLLAKYRADLTDFMRSFVINSMFFSCFLLLAYSKWHAWHGAWYWGPRFLLPLAVLGCLYFALLARLWLPRSGWRGAVIVLVALLSYMSYKVGVGVGQEPLISCLETTANSDACYWQWRFLPLVSWVNMGDLHEMLTDRSTAVEIVSCFLLFVLFRYAPAETRMSMRPQARERRI